MFRYRDWFACDLPSLRNKSCLIILSHHHHVPVVVKVMQGVPCVTPDPMQVPLPLERQKVFVLYRKVVRPHEPWSSAPGKVKFSLLNILSQTTLTFLDDVCERAAVICRNLAGSSLLICSPSPTTPDQCQSWKNQSINQSSSSWIYFHLRSSV